MPSINTNTNQPICNVRTNWPAYIVQYGDTLTFIARQSNTTVATLVVANCLIDPDRILVGQSIRIPQEITNTLSS
jgi:LysM repeat protein